MPWQATAAGLLSSARTVGAAATSAMITGLKRKIRRRTHGASHDATRRGQVYAATRPKRPPEVRPTQARRAWGDVVGMNAPALDIAHRTASSAGPFAATLAFDCAQIAHAMRAGEVRHALATLEATTDRLQRFLTFVVVSSELLGRANAPLGAVIADYGRRIIDLVGRVDGSLQHADLVGLTLVLEHGLGPALNDYGGYADAVTHALSPRLAA